MRCGITASLLWESAITDGSWGLEGKAWWPPQPLEVGYRLGHLTQLGWLCFSKQLPPKSAHADSKVPENVRLMTGMGAGERAGLDLECVPGGAVESHKDEFVKSR